MVHRGKPARRWIIASASATIIPLALMAFLTMMSRLYQQDYQGSSYNHHASSSAAATTTASSKVSFNCQSKDSLAKCFSVRDFLLEHQQSSIRSNSAIPGFTNPNLPALVGNQNVGYVHLHKCGGTSIKAALFAADHRSSSTTTKTKSYKHSFGGGSKARKEQNDKARSQYIESIVQGQQHSTSSTTEGFPLFTLIRNPVDRFLSAIQQVMHYNDDFRQKCLKRTPRATIACAIKDMEEQNNGFRNDVHLLPMISHFRLLEHVPQISIFRFEDIDLILNALSSSSGTSKRTHVHDRSSETYATSKVLSKMSSNDCDSLMLERICQLYAMDVVMMRYLGMEISYCNN